MKDFTDRREPRISREITENVRPMNLDGLELIGMDDNVYVNDYNLTGRNMMYAIIDGGMVLSTHQEFSNLANRVNKNESGGTDAHATHVAGTSGAYGARPTARGVAPEVTIQSFSFTNATSKMQTCGANGYNAVNNSWGYYRGWDNVSGIWYWDGFPYEWYIQNYQTNLPFASPMNNI